MAMGEILHERQYWMTRSKLRELEAELERARGNADQLPSRMHEAVLKSLNSRIVGLACEISVYEATKKSGGMRFDFESLADLPLALLRARLSLGWTQERLAEELNMRKQQIQRYERTFYESASFRRILEVASALGVGVSGTAKTYSDRVSPSGLDRQAVRQTLAGFSAAAAFQDVEHRLRLRAMTTLEAREIFDDLCKTYSWLSETHGTTTMARDERLVHRLSLGRAMEALARKRGDLP
jgi:transcriptional regulator with XRE-family HTH domain